MEVVVVEPGPFTTELFPQSPRPKDEDNRTQSYPEVAAQTFNGLGAAFEEMFKDPEVPTDPVDVVDRYVELIDMAPTLTLLLTSQLIRPQQSYSPK